MSCLQVTDSLLPLNSFWEFQKDNVLRSKNCLLQPLCGILPFSSPVPLSAAVPRGLQDTTVAYYYGQWSPSWDQRAPARTELTSQGIEFCWKLLAHPSDLRSSSASLCRSKSKPVNCSFSLLSLPSPLFQIIRSLGKRLVPFQ